ncbi:MAG: metallophosphoesterase family protein [Chloroflexi bacterium]|nr:metallophosphoesterase family protein [Chloroflexota bacterium]
MRIALISDIHGNLTAFQAVLADIARSYVDQIVFLGDASALGPQPKAVVDLLQALGCACIKGNHEDYELNWAQFLPNTPEGWIKATMAWGVAQLSQANLDFLRTFQPTLTIPLDQNNPQFALLCCHGSPQSYDDMMLATTPAVELDHWLIGQPMPVIASGHTHIQMLRRHRAQLLINPGSVGSPMQEMPFIGAPTLLPWAEYAIVDYTQQRLSVELRQVRYDLALAKEVALTSGMPEPEVWVRQWKTEEGHIG